MTEDMRVSESFARGTCAMLRAAVLEGASRMLMAFAERLLGPYFAEQFDAETRWEDDGGPPAPEEEP